MQSKIFHLLNALLVLFWAGTAAAQGELAPIATAPGNGNPGVSADGSNPAPATTPTPPAAKATGEGKGAYRFNQSENNAPTLLNPNNGPAPSLNGRVGTEAYTPTWTPPRPASTDGEVFFGEVGDFTRSNVEMTIQNEVFRIPRSKFSEEDDIRPGVKLSVRLTADEVKRYKRNKKIKSELLKRFN